MKTLKTLKTAKRRIIKKLLCIRSLILYSLLYGMLMFGFMGFTAESLHWQAPQESEQTQDDVIYEDGHIGIKIDNIEKTNDYPSELKVANQQYYPPREGHKYLLVYLTIEFIKDIHVVGFGGSNDTKLSDTYANEYNLFAWNATGLKFSGPDKKLNSPKEYDVGAKVVLIFEIPESNHPAALSFVYYFKEKWYDGHSHKGQINLEIKDMKT